jgi:hypothetical protein
VHVHEIVAQALGYVAAVVTVTVATLLGWFLFGEMHLTDVVMVFLLGVVIVSMRFGYGPSIVTAVLSVLAFEFFFIPPLFSFAVSDLRHFVTFAVMFLVAFVIRHLTKRIRDQADAARARERNTASLYEASGEILAYSREALLLSSRKHGREMFGADVAVVLLGGEEGDAPVPPGAVLVPMKGSRGPMGVSSASPGGGLAPARFGRARALADCSLRGVPIAVDRVSYFLGRETLLPSGEARMHPRRKRLCSSIARNAVPATAYFGLPPGRVVELGMQIRL